MASQYVTKVGNQLMYKGQRFRYIGFNKYTMIVNSETQASMTNYFNAAKSKGMMVCRTWVFDRDHPTTTNVKGNFRYLADVVVGDNIIANPGFETDITGWAMDADFTRSTANAHTGVASIAQNSTSGFRNFYTANDGVGIPVTPNTNYTVKYWRNINVVGNAPIIDINVGNAFGTTIASAFPGGTGGAWVESSFTFNSGANSKVWIRVHNNNGAVTGYWDDFSIGVGSGKTLNWVESTLQQVDLFLDELRKRQMKAVMVLSEGNLYFGSYDTKITYFNWVNAIYGENLVNTENYEQFFTSPGARTLFKQFIYGLVNRVNTINGRLYRDDDTIMTWELGNEHTFKKSAGDTNVDTVNSRNILAMVDWITDMCTYIKSIDPNHLTSFSDPRQGAARYYDPGGSGQQDWVWNGSYYGIDYETFAAIPNLDILSFHSYPNQGLGSSNIRPYGFKFGIPYTRRTDGYRAQIRDFIEKTKAGGKVCEFGEIGYAREDTGTMVGWPMYPRILAFQSIMEEIFDHDGDGMLIWDATVTGGGSFSVGLAEIDTTGYWGTNENKNDSMLTKLFNNRNTELVDPNKRARSV